MSIKDLKIPVGYMGNKRKFAAKIVDACDLTRSEHYAEPFVGMGAVYLEMRRRGWRGEAHLNDLNAGVSALWTCVHDKDLFDAMLAAARGHLSLPTTNAIWELVAEEGVPDDLPTRAARWLWLQEGAFGSVPVTFAKGRVAKRGCAFDSHTEQRDSGRKAAKHEFARNIALLETLRPLVGLPTAVTCAPCADLDLGEADAVYADPPYVETGKYSIATNFDYVGWAASLVAPGRVVALSEQTIKPPDGFVEVALGDRPTACIRGTSSADVRERLFVRDLRSPCAPSRNAIRS